MEKIRSSNYELMRIISMFLIVLGHVLLHGKVLVNVENQGFEILLDIIEFLTLVHVNSFILLTGYFQSTNKFKQSKLWSLINSCYFYRIVILILFSLLGIISVNKLTIFKELFPLNTMDYWFYKEYFYLYCLSPFINKSISSFSKSTFKKLLIVLFVLISIFPNISGGDLFINNGYTLYNFIFIYLIGAYIRKYPVEDNYILKKFSPRFNQILFLSIFFICGLLNYFITRCIVTMQGYNSFTDELARIASNASISYSNPIIIIQTIAYFLFFSTLKFKSKFVNNISKLVMGVYLIHDNKYVRENIYTWFGLNVYPITSHLFIFRILGSVLIIYIVCLFIEWFRQLLFRFIYNLKISYNIRDKYYKFLDSIYINN